MLMGGVPEDPGADEGVKLLKFIPARVFPGDFFYGHVEEPEARARVRMHSANIMRTCTTSLLCNSAFHLCNGSWRLT
jgi:hypothetical protein